MNRKHLNNKKKKENSQKMIWNIIKISLKQLMKNTKIYYFKMLNLTIKMNINNKDQIEKVEELQQ